MTRLWRALWPALQKRQALLLFSIAAFFYGALYRRADLGAFNDDALYVVAAKSLLQGRYVRLYHPLQMPMNDPLPGYPAFLAPFVWLMQPHWALLKWIGVLLTIGSGFLLWRWLLRALPKGWALVGLALFLLHPLTATMASTVMSEPCFTFFVLLALVLLDLESEKEKIGRVVLLGVVCGWAALIRPQGLALIVAATLALFGIRRWGAGATVGLMGSLMWGGVMARNALVTPSATGYLGRWQLMATLFDGSWVTPLLNAGLYLKQLGSLVLYPTVDLRIGNIAASLGIVVMGSYGAFVWVRRAKQPASAFAAAVFGLLYSVLHVLWTASTPRYFLPLLPISIGFFLMGLRPAVEKRLFSERLALAWPWLLVVIALLGNVRELLAVVHNRIPAENRLPQRTLAWITHNTPSDAVFLGKAPLIYLYTGRHAVSAIPSEDVNTFRYRMLTWGVGVVLVQPRAPVSIGLKSLLDPARLWEQEVEWLRGNPKWFERIYADPAEGTELFRVLSAPSFVAGYEAHAPAKRTLSPRKDKS